MAGDIEGANISERFINELVYYCSNQILIEKVIMFGSRARGDFRSDSDIELAICTNNAIHSRQNLIEFNIQEMSTHLKIDIVFIDRLNKEKLLSNFKQRRS